MNYCRYRKSDNYILETSPNTLIEDEETSVCFINIDLNPNFHMYVKEINDNNELTALFGYLKEV